MSQGPVCFEPRRPKASLPPNDKDVVDDVNRIMAQNVPEIPIGGVLTVKIVRLQNGQTKLQSANIAKNLSLTDEVK